MKLFIRLLLLLVVLAGNLNAQVGRGKITAAEFYYDTDPGQGSGTALTLQGNLNDAMRTAIQSTSQSLAVGKHSINVRMKDSLGHWGPVFKTTLSVESPATSRSISVTLARVYWDANVGGATNLIMLNGNVANAINSFITSSAISTFPAAGDHAINVQVLDATGQWSPAFTTVIAVESPSAAPRPISASLARVYWDANVGGATNLILLNGNATNAINSFITSSAVSTFPSAGDHAINVQLMDPTGQWGPAFTTVIAVESPTAAPRIISASLARVYWDANTAGATNMIMVNGNIANSINSFITSSPISSFPSAGSHNINVQVLDGTSHWSPAFTTTIAVESPVSFTRIISAALGRAYWDSNLGTTVGLIILNGNAGSAVNEFITATSLSTFSTAGVHKLNVQLLDPNGSGNYSPAFSTIVKVDNAIDTVRAIRVDAARVWFDNNVPASPNMIAFDGNFNEAIESAVQTLAAPGLGLHTLNVQVRDSVPTHWGPIFKTSFIIENPISYRNINVVTGQLYWDNDTLNNPVTLLAFDGAFDNAIEQAFKNNVPTLPTGLHTICVRFKDVANSWSNPFKLSITIEDSLFARNIKVIQGEVRIDNTPPLTIVSLNGNFSNALEQTQSTLLSSGIPVGLHRLMVRMKGLDGNWGPYFISSIVVSPCASTPMPTITHTLPLAFCNPDSTVLSAPSGFTSYQWVYNNSIVGTGQTLVARDSGSYIVIVTDVTNCPGASLPTVVNSHHPIVNITTGPVFCQGSIDTLYATPGFTSYVWSGGGTGNKKAISAGGSYTVTATDAFGCTTSTSITITQLPQPPTPTIMANGPTSLCPGMNVTLTSSANSNILWNNGQTAQSFTVDTTGSYTVTVTGANGCKSTSTITNVVKHNTTPVTVSANGPLTFCNGNNVTLTVNPGGLSYIWYNSGVATGSTARSTAITSTGTYSVTMIDSNSCPTSSASTIVTVNPNPTVPTISANGPLSFCNGSNVLLTSSSASNNTWNNGITSQSQTVYISGTFIDTVTNVFGCKSWSSPAVINVHPVASISASGPTTFCFGGSVTLTASPASGVTYLWSNGATTPSVNITSTQNLSMIATEIGLGCRDTAYMNVLVNPLPTGSIAAQGPITVCSGNTVTFNATGSAHTKFRWFLNGSPITNYSYNINCSCYVPYYTYGNSFSTGSGGTYTAEIIDTLTGCISMTNSIVATFIVPPQPVITANGGTTVCIGANTTLSSTPAVSYLWSTGATTQTIVASTQGNYVVTITDINGCTRASNVTPVSFYPVASITTSGPTTFCAGANVSLTGHPSGTFLWSNGSTNATLSNITTSGSYSLTVTDVNGCASNAGPVNIVVNPLPLGNITAAGPTTICSGNAVTLNTSGSPNCIYKWYVNGSPITYFSYSIYCSCYTPYNVFGYSYAASTTGTYSAEIIDTLTGCSSMTNSIAVNVLSLPVPSISQTAFLQCNGATNATLNATASGTVSPYMYLWNTGATTQTISSLAAATYTVRVTDNNGCTSTTGYIVTQPAAVSASATTPTNTRGYNVSCHGSSNGSATVFPSGGTPPYTYLWSTGATTSTITGLSAGTYTVTVHDSHNCAAATATVTLVQPASISLTVSPHVFYGGKNISCFGGSNGSITALPTGGTANFTYLWSNGQTGQTAVGLSLGSYSVIATDSVGCTASSSAALTQPALLTKTLTASIFSGYNVSCHGMNNGTINVTTGGGTAPYHYFWTDTAYTQNRTSLYAGNYHVIITDTLGCVATDSIILHEPTAIVTNVTGSLLNCYGDHNGTASVSASGGNSPYTYTWSTGATSPGISNLAANFYLVTVTDSRACTKVAQVQVIQPTQVTAYAFGTYIGCGNQIGLLSVTGSGGNGPYTFSWSNGSTAPFQANQPLGTYSVTVTDTHGCWDTANAIILSPPILNASSTNFMTNCDSITTVPSGILSVTASGGVTPYLYLWSNGQTTPTINHLGTGDYSVIVTDANGCSVTRTSYVHNNDPAPIIGEDTICNGTQASLSTPTGLAYTWSNSGGVVGNTQNILVGAGTYTLTATNLNGCTHSSTIQIVSQQCNTIVNLNLYLESYYSGFGNMVSTLMNEGVGSNPDLTDTIVIQLRDNHAPYSVVSSKKALLHTDGTVTCNFPTIFGWHYISVSHRNTVQTWSSDSILLGPNPTNYDFTTAANKAYGDNMIEIEPGIWAFYTGDLNHDENVDLLDLSILENDINNFAYNYIATDINGDGNADLLDIPIIEDNINNFIGSIQPN